jgi:hypothetical protein
MTRAEIARAANAVRAAARNMGGAPRLAAASDLPALCAWLQACDPNGCHTPELAAAEHCDPYTIEDAWAAIAAMCEEG